MNEQLWEIRMNGRHVATVHGTKNDAWWIGHDMRGPDVSVHTPTMQIMQTFVSVCAWCYPGHPSHEWLSSDCCEPCMNLQLAAYGLEVSKV